MSTPSTFSLSTLSPQLRKFVIQTFTKKYSLQLHASALTFIAATLSEHDLLHVAPGDAEEVTKQRDAVEILAKGCLDLTVLEEAGASEGSIVTAKQLQHVYSQLVADGNTVASAPNAINRDGSAGSGHELIVEEEAPPPGRWFDVIDAFDLPRIQWDSVTKTFVK